MRRIVRIPFNDVVDATMSKLWDWVGKHGVTPAGPPFLKYNVIDMAKDLEIEFGVPTAKVLQPDDAVITGTLPAGRYVSLTYFGHYNELVEVNAVLIGWAQLHQIKFDMQSTPKGDKFASRLEFYANNPRDVPNPDDWETMLAFKIADEAGR